MSVKPNKVVLVVTGSIAACKTCEIIDALRAKNCVVDVFLTKAPETWQHKRKWVPIDDIRRGNTDGSVYTESSPTDAKEGSIKNADILLIAPATADFISQLLYETSPLARALREKASQGTPLLVAPAMNVMMWEHPSVRRNCAELAKQGLRFLGPDEGVMACGDFGFGRMMKVNDIAEGLRAALDGKSCDAFRLYDDACKSATRKNRPARESAEKRLLVVLAGKSMTSKDVKTLVSDIKAEGFASTYVLGPEAHCHRKKLEALTGQKVITDHYQVDGLDGLEHIKLPEAVTCVYYPFIDKNVAERMRQGATGDLSLDIYLASKSPVVASLSPNDKPEAQQIEGLIGDGLTFIGALHELANA